MTKKIELSKWLGAIWLLPIFIPVTIPNLFSILTIAIIPLAVNNILKRNFFKRRKIIHSLFLLFVLYIYISGIFLSEVNDFFTKYVVLQFEGILVFFIITTIYSIKDIQFLTSLILTYTLIGVLIGVIQFQFGIGQEYLHYSNGKAEFFRRPIPAGLDPNYYFLNLIYPLVFSIYKFVKTPIGKTKIIYLTLSSVFILGTFFTGSKAALIILFIIILFVFLNKLKYAIVGSVSLILFLIFLLPILIEALPYIFSRYELLLSGNLNDVTSHRNIMWEVSWNHFLNNPIFGVGIGQMVKYYSSIQSFVEIGGQTTHNTLLHLLAETGLIGFLLWCSPMFILIKSSFSKDKQLFTVLFCTIIMLLSIDASYSKTVFIYLGIAYLMTYYEKNNSYTSL